MFDHEKLEVYQVSIQLVTKINEITSAVPKGYSKLNDQLFRASTSISLNIAEGAGLYTKKEKTRSYRIARGSAMECAAAIDVFATLKLAPSTPSTQAKELLHRIVAMLTKLIQRLNESD